MALGTDGVSSNNTTDLFEDMKIAAMLQNGVEHDPLALLPSDALRMATVNGAKTLGREDLGSLEPEKGADLFFIDTRKLELTGTLHDPRNLLARAGVTGETALTMVNGRVVFRDGHFPGVDEEGLAREGEAVCTRVLREPFDAFHNLC